MQSTSEPCDSCPNQLYVNTLINSMASCFADVSSLCVATTFFIWRERKDWKVETLASDGFAMIHSQRIPRIKSTDYSLILDNLMMISPSKDNVLVADFDFQSRFNIRKQTQLYSRFLRSIPFVFLGTLQQLFTELDIIAEHMELCYREQEESIPPWRSLSTMKAAYRAAFTDLRKYWKTASPTARKMLRLSEQLSHFPMYCNSHPTESIFASSGISITPTDGSWICSSSATAVQPEGELWAGHPAKYFFMQLAVCDLSRSRSTTHGIVNIKPLPLRSGLKRPIEPIKPTRAPIDVPSAFGPYSCHPCCFTSATTFPGDQEMGIPGSSSPIFASPEASPLIPSSRRRPSFPCGEDLVETASNLGSPCLAPTLDPSALTFDPLLSVIPEPSAVDEIIGELGNHEEILSFPSNSGTPCAFSASPARSSLSRSPCSWMPLPHLPSTSSTSCIAVVPPFPLVSPHGAARPMTSPHPTHSSSLSTPNEPRRISSNWHLSSPHTLRLSRANLASVAMFTMGASLLSPLRIPNTTTTGYHSEENVMLPESVLSSPSSLYANSECNFEEDDDFRHTLDKRAASPVAVHSPVSMLSLAIRNRQQTEELLQFF